MDPSRYTTFPSMRTLVALCALLVAAGSPGADPIAAQEVELCTSPDTLRDWLDSIEEVRDRYAPEFIFAPGERYLPTMSFFTALDGRDNDDDGLTDFEDPDEIAALENGRPSWDFLDRHYPRARSPDDTRPLEIAAIYHQVRRLQAAEVADMWRFLISDEQAWRRFDIDRASLLPTLRSDTTKFLSVEYHAYYINDLGLIGHGYDTEYVRMFVPEHPSLADRFRIIVGAGHTDRVPNNVLVLTGRVAARENGTDPGILVELGDHSSAPDIEPRGAFSPGYDANWHAHDLWGTRDVQSSSGLGALGPYETWMTFPRDSVVQPLALHYDVGESPMEHEAAQRRMKIPESEEDRLGGYRLISARAFECLFDEIDDDPPPARVEAWLELAHDDFGREFRRLTPAGQREAVEGMKRWREGLTVDRDGHRRGYWRAPSQRRGPHRLDRSKVLIWESKHYRASPSEAFKQHLFRPVVGALTRFEHWLDLFHLWLTWQPNRGAMLQAGFEIPAFHLPFRLPGYLEAQAGIYGSCPNVVDDCGVGGESPAFSLLHTWHYNQPITWYNRLTWIPEREQAERDPEAADWLVGGGMSLTVWLFRLRVGLATDLRWKRGPQLGGTTWELILSRL